MRFLAQQKAHAELVNLHAGQIANFGFTGFRLAGDGSYRLVWRILVLPVQLFDGVVEGRGLAVVLWFIGKVAKHYH